MRHYSNDEFGFDDILFEDELDADFNDEDFDDAFPEFDDEDVFVEEVSTMCPECGQNTVFDDLCSNCGWENTMLDSEDY